MKTLNFLAITLMLCQKATANDITPAKVCTKSNEMYTSCGTACPLTCENYENPPKVCTLQCVIGCVCKPGYVKNKEGNCVLPAQCKPNVTACTRKFEAYNACGTACPLTCKNYTKPPPCTKQCVPGCFCLVGYVRNDAGNCVKPSECRKCVRSHEVYNECGTACPLTCANYKNPPKFCTKQCVIGCQCKQGYLRNKNGDCVLPCQC